MRQIVAQDNKLKLDSVKLNHAAWETVSLQQLLGVNHKNVRTALHKIQWKAIIHVSCITLLTLCLH